MLAWQPRWEEVYLVILGMTAQCVNGRRRKPLSDSRSVRLPKPS